MLPEFNDKRLKISFIIPIAIAVCSTFFKIGFFMALLITLAETFMFWLLIVMFAEIFIYLNPTDREAKWKEMSYFANIAIIPLFLTGCLLPAVRNMRDAAFPADDSWASMQALTNNIGFQILVQLPNIIAIITTVLIILLLAISINKIHEVDILKSILFSIAIGVLAFTVSTVIVAYPFSLL